MIRPLLSRLSLPLVSVALVAMTGCAFVSNSSSMHVAVPAVGASTMTGKTFGGFQPIGYANIGLYSAGSTGYGLGATLRATATTANDGSFSFTKQTTASDTIASTGSSWACPTTGDPLIYLVATGGNPTGNSLTTPVNTGIALMVPLGVCSTVSASTYVVLNEATTVATVAALQQFLNPATRSIGSSSSASSMQALLDAAATVTNLVDVIHGVARSTTLTNSGGYNVSGVTVTVTPEINKIYTIANILAACVNSTPNTSTGCSTLFTSAVPTNPTYTSQPTVTFATATDTLMAAYYMLTNPTSGAAATNDAQATNLNALFALQVPTSPFQPALTGAPTDWTIGIRYDAGTINAGTAADVPNCGVTGAGKFLSYAYHLSVDASGNIWAVSDTAGSGISEISPTGVPLSCALDGASTAGFTSASIDPAGSLWVTGATAPSLYEWIPGTSTSYTWPAPVTTGLFSVVSDGNNNIMYSYSGILYQIPAAKALAGNPSSTPANNETQISSGIKTQPYFLAADTTGSIFASYQGSSTAASEALFDVYPGQTGTGSLGGYKTTSFTTGGTNYINYYGLAVGKGGKVWAVNGAAATFASTQNTFASFTPSGLGTGTASAPTAPNFAGVNSAREIAIDGAGNIFTTNAVATAGNYVSGATSYTCSTAVGVYPTNVGTCWSFSEIANDGTAISATGTGTSTTTVNGAFQKDYTILPYYGRGVAITASGNLWIGSNSGNGRGITEIVGAAVPVVTPLSQALKQGNAILMP